jgi:general secretion pathway protein A
MYQSFFGLAEAPFSIAPDPRYLYMSRKHQEALAHLLYGLNGDGGFVLLTGEVGTGKTTVCRCLLEQIPESCDVAYIFNPRLTVAELLSTICKEFGITYPSGNTSIKVFVDCINTHLLDAHAKGRHTVLIIDEAQNLSADVLEQMRLLTNLETNRRKLLQIILLGQPELAEMLARPELRQLAQRIVARYHLGPLAKAEVETYVRHRLDVSGAKQQLIPAALTGRLHRLSGGVPRVLNVLCDRALLGAFAQGKEKVDRATLAQASREVFGRPATKRRSAARAVAASLTLIASAALAVAVYHQERGGSETRSAPQSTTPALLSAVPEQPANLAAKVEAPLPDVLAWTSDQPQSRSKAIAYAALFNAWGEKNVDTNSCERAERNGLHCRMGRGGLDELRRLNRPAVLQMRDDHGREFFACLTGLDDQSATFDLGADTQRVTLAALASQWSGHYTVLLRMPPELQRTIRQGERGPAVLWLSQQLARVHGREVEPSSNAVFDDAMVRQVKQFQLAQGLIPDGTVGTQTLMHLSSAADRSAPTLSRASGEK